MRDKYQTMLPRQAFTTEPQQNHKTSRTSFENWRGLRRSRRRHHSTLCKQTIGATEKCHHAQRTFWTQLCINTALRAVILAWPVQQHSKIQLTVLSVMLKRKAKVLCSLLRTAASLPQISQQKIEPFCKLLSKHPSAYACPLVSALECTKTGASIRSWRNPAFAPNLCSLP